MDKRAIIYALKECNLTAKDISSIEDGDTKAKIYLQRGKGCIYVEQITTVFRRKKQPDGRMSMYMTHPDNLYKYRYNVGKWASFEL